MARPTHVPGLAVFGFRWDLSDQQTRRWWPQGISTIDDSMLVISSYAKPIGGVREGARLTFVDRGSLRYRHVLLVEPVTASDVRPVQVHVGGVATQNGWVHLAATGSGLRSARLDDIVRLRRAQLHTYGYEYVLPMRLTYDARADEGDQPLRFSFVSLSDGSLAMGEYGHGDMTTRLATFALPSSQQDAVVRPTLLDAGGAERMHGVAVVDGTWYVTTGAGPRHPGSVWVGEPGSLRRVPLTLPSGLEDLAYDAASDWLWTLTEYPRRRYVLALDRAHL